MKKLMVDLSLTSVGISLGSAAIACNRALGGYLSLL